jgi:nitrogen fixation/metabolism regulation signal transduction histidine kinase
VPKSSIKRKNRVINLPHVAWHQWSVVRLAAIAMVTVLAGYLTAAILAVKSIDYLLHIAHDPAIEQAITQGMESQKEAYKSQQQLLQIKIQNLIKNPSSISSPQLSKSLDAVRAGDIFKSTNFTIVPTSEKKDRPIYWLNRSDLVVGKHLVRFENSAQEDEYRKTEDILKRYKIIGFELSARIRPALIRALTVTLAIMCALLMIAFTYMTLRSKTRIQKIVQGFIRYAHGEDAFRFNVHGHNELGLLSRQFNHMADELAENRRRAVGLEKLASWQTIARKMAHEIKNPLTPIQIMIGQLHRNYQGPDHDYGKLLEKAHHVILEEVASLRRMVDDFSQFAQLPSPRLAETNATTCARQTVQLAEDSYKPHPILYEGPSEHVHGELDDQLIRLALHNLIKNAAEADPHASSPIILRLQHTPASIIFEVEDNGPGIPEDIRQNIFEAYVTTKHTGPNPGMGLGLAICQKIVLEHGGKIELASKPGKTIFRLILPRTHKGGASESQDQRD